MQEERGEVHRRRRRAMGTFYLAEAGLRVALALLKRGLLPYRNEESCGYSG